MCANQASTVSILRNILMCARSRLIDLGLGLEIMMARNRWRLSTGVMQTERVLGGMVCLHCYQEPTSNVRHKRITSSYANRMFHTSASRYCSHHNFKVRINIFMSTFHFLITQCTHLFSISRNERADCTITEKLIRRYRYEKHVLISIERCPTARCYSTS